MTKTDQKFIKNQLEAFQKTISKIITVSLSVLKKEINLKIDSLETKIETEVGNLARMTQEEFLKVHGRIDGLEMRVSAVDARLEALAPKVIR